VILIDTNLLLYAYHSNSAHHNAARRWLEGVFSRPEPVSVAWVSVLAFLRISTDTRMPGQLFSMAEAVSIVNDWIAQPNFGIFSAGERHWEILAALAVQSQARGPLVTDSHLAALAIEHGATLCTADQDFRRFSGLRLDYPLDAE
jgi:toxin-antitoxin system PIN domain toxin